MTLLTTFQSKLIDYVRDFVRIDSRSSPTGGNEGRLQRVMAEHQRRLGARVRQWEVDDLPEARAHPLFHDPSRDYRDRPTVVGEIGPENAPSLLLLAHSDTVPLFEPEEWTVDPFGAEMHSGRIYGLGSSDDKWGLATLVVLMEAFQSWDPPLPKRLLFASTIDEENGVANGTLLLHLAGIEAEAALYLDGSRMEVCIGCLGGSNLILRPRGPIRPPDFERHFAALTEAAEGLSRRRSLRFDRPLFRENSMRDRAVLVNRRSDATGPFLLVPFYSLPGEEPTSLCRELEAMVASALGPQVDRYDLSYRHPWFEPALVDPETPLIHHLSQAVETVLGQPARIGTISKQDSFLLTNHAQIPTVSFGVTARVWGRGAHHFPDEYIEVEELWNGCQIAYDAVARWLRC